MADRTIKRAVFPLPDSTYQKLAEKFYSPLLYHESAVMLCPPLYGREHNARYMMERSSDRTRVLGNKEKQFQFSYVNLLDSPNVDTTLWTKQLLGGLVIGETYGRTFTKFCKAVHSVIDEGNNPVFFVNIPETISDDTFFRFLELARQTYYIAPGSIHFLLMFDMKWDEEHFYKCFTPYRTLFENVIQPAMYSDTEVSYFVSYWLRAWNHTLSKLVIYTIVSYAGGILLFAKAMVRVMSQQKLTTIADVESLIVHPDYVVQIQFFLSRLTPKQKTILTDITRGKLLKPTSELLHLYTMGILEKTVTGYHIRSLTLRSFLSKTVKQKSEIGKMIERSTVFSQREKLVLLALGEKRGMSVSRDKLSSVLWGERALDDGSDWALDQAISRIRKKIHKVSELSLMHITTHKKRGFSIS